MSTGARRTPIVPWIASVGAGILLALGAVGIRGAIRPDAATSRAAVPDVALAPLEGEAVAHLTAPPLVPPPVDRTHATRVVVELETVERTGLLAPGVEYRYWTFGGTVPGSFIRVREGDELEIRLTNGATSVVPHNIDLHAVTGPGGGAEASWTAPGGESVFRFRALRPGLYVYHCAVPAVGQHLANGMYGLILVEPAEGLPPVDHEYYVMQGEFYTVGAHGERGLQDFSYDKAVRENPDYVVFNGAKGALTGDGALRARVGETVRLFVGNGGPNLVSSFHLIGEIFDNVFAEGGSAPTHNVQTTLVPAGGSAMVEFRVDVPGTYTLVDHSIFRATDLGANGQLIVEGDTPQAIFTPDAQPDVAAR